MEKKKAIIIRGKKDAGKSTTIKEVCKNLNPQNVYKLDTKEKIYNEEEIENICNDIYLITVNGKWILVFAGSPTEINIKISLAIEVCFEIGIDISFALVSTRSSERKEGFNTKEELKEKKFEIIVNKKIEKIEKSKFDKTPEWEERIDDIVDMVKKNL